MSSINIENYEEWKNDDQFIEDVMRFLDNVMTDFINRAPNSFDNAKYSAMRERSVGLGVMGLHSFFQQKNIPFGSVMSKVWNQKFFKHIYDKTNEASLKLAEERGACPDAQEYGINEDTKQDCNSAYGFNINYMWWRFTRVEPIAANSYTHKTLSGSYKTETNI